MYIRKKSGHILNALCLLAYILKVILRRVYQCSVQVIKRYMSIIDNKHNKQGDDRCTFSSATFYGTQLTISC